MARAGPLRKEDLRAAFGPVPFDGRAAQRRMEPSRRGPRPPGHEGRALRDAAALAYVFERGGHLLFPLTLRAHALREHAGQVSLPGGRPHDGEDLLATARREADEEIGLRRDGEIEVLGRLAPVLIPISHSRLHVFVALGPDPGAFVPDPAEVARVVPVRLDDLVDPACCRERPWPVAGSEIPVPYYDVSGLFLWGATAMALSELVARLHAVIA